MLRLSEVRVLAASWCEVRITLCMQHMQQLVAALAMLWAVQRNMHARHPYYVYEVTPVLLQTCHPIATPAVTQIAQMHPVLAAKPCPDACSVRPCTSRI